VGVTSRRQDERRRIDDMEPRRNWAWTMVVAFRRRIQDSSKDHQRELDGGWR
jgi:hypothetical protein